MWFILKILISASIISFFFCLANTRPQLAGFIVALPTTTMLVLALSYAEFGDTTKTVEFAKGIFWGVPVSLLFFVPFLFANYFKVGFWVYYIAGFVLLAGGYFAHRFITQIM